MSKEFDKWMEQEKAKGLVSIHFTTVGNPTDEQIKEFILASEKAIREGRFRSVPSLEDK